jgi:predicted esterase
MKLPLILLFLTVGLVCGRTWTDVQGRKVEGEMVRVEAGSPVVSINGKEMTLPLDKLSAEDQQFVQGWAQAAEEKAKEEAAALAAKAEENAKRVAAGIFSVDGTQLEKAGKLSLVERPYSPASLEYLVKNKLEKETSYKVGIVLPAGFDPSKPLRVFVVSTPVNNPAEGVGGNIGKMRMYMKTCAEQGWLTVAFDSNTGYPMSHLAIKEGMELLVKEWPILKTSDFAVGGFSGGAAACWIPCATLVKEGYRVMGAFMAGNNGDYSATDRKTYGAPAKPYGDINVFVSSGELDKNASPEGAKGLRESLKSNGLGTVRLESHAGGHKLHEPHFSEALTWFVAEAEKKGNKD